MSNEKNRLQLSHVGLEWHGNRKVLERKQLVSVGEMDLTHELRRQHVFSFNDCPL